MSDCRPGDLQLRPGRQPYQDDAGYLYDNSGPADTLPARYAGQRTKVTYPGGTKTASYTYLPDGRMASVTDWLANQTVYSYDPSGQLIHTLYPNGAFTDYTYDAADRLTVVENATFNAATNASVPISTYTYTLDAAGNRKTRQETLGTGSPANETYCYDNLNRLASEDAVNCTNSGPNQTYGYDAVGNRTTLATSSGTTNNQYDAADQLNCSWSGPASPACPTGSTTLLYWPNGNQKTRTTTAGTDNFTYDQENRLTQATIAGTNSSYTYNGDGLRMSRTVAATTTNYVWDVSQSPPVVLQDGANTYVYGLGLISATDASSSQSYFLYDGLGSTTGLTNSSATLTDTYSYDVFGALLSHTGSSTNYWQFTGQQSDSASNLYYLRARYYDPASGRFLTGDPIPGQPTAPQTWNRYAYASNNPTNRIDPAGLHDSETAGIPRACIKLFEGLLLQALSPQVLLKALAPGLLVPEFAPLVVGLEVMYIYTETFIVTTEVLQAYEEANRTGQAVSSADLTGILAHALGREGLGQARGLPALAVDFINCARSN